jgi:hypothetical protein
LEDYAVLFSAN